MPRIGFAVPLLYSRLSHPCFAHFLRALWNPCFETLAVLAGSHSMCQIAWWIAAVFPLSCTTRCAPPSSIAWRFGLMLAVTRAHASQGTTRPRTCTPRSTGGVIRKVSYTNHTQQASPIKRHKSCGCSQRVKWNDAGKWSVGRAAALTVKKLPKIAGDRRYTSARSPSQLP